jgi:nucleoid DNA-binding protein
MNKTKLIDEVAESTRLPKAHVAEIADKLINAISDQITSGGTVKIRNFGTFKLLRKRARTGTNPRTKEPLEIPAATAIKFVPAKELVAEVNG